MNKDNPFDILLVEPSNLLRRTVSLTVRSLGTAEVTEAATYQTAQQVAELRRIDGAVIALEWPPRGDTCEGLTLIHQIRLGRCVSAPAIPIAVLVESCDTALLQLLRASDISRILIKPFRVRDVIDTIASMRDRARGAAGAQAPQSSGTLR